MLTMRKMQKESGLIPGEIQRAGRGALPVFIFPLSYQETV